MNSTKMIRGMYTLGLVISLLIGIWHFFVPYMFSWYSYIPDVPIQIKVSIDYINFFFSLLLAGNSLSLLCLKKRIFAGNREALVFYSFLVFVWLCRVIIIIILPWNGVYDLMFMGQLVGFTVLFIIMLIPMLKLISLNRKSCNKEG